MKISICQPDTAWLQPTANRHRIEQFLSAATDTQLLVLPEMFSTGFCLQPHLCAEPEPHETLQWMHRMARQHHAALAGSLAVRDGANYHNRFYFVLPNGNVHSYDKRHLFSPAGEDRAYTAGRQRVIVSWGGVRFLLQVCYDLRFPVFSRNRHDYDAAIYVANWPATRQTAWEQLLRARALENQCYVIGVNRTGRDPHNAYGGGSAVIGPQGETLALCKPHSEDLQNADLDMEALRGVRQQFPVLDDGDTFSMDLL